MILFGCRKQVDQFKAVTVEERRDEICSFHLSLLFLNLKESNVKQNVTEKAHTVHPLFKLDDKETGNFASSDVCVGSTTLAP